MKHNYLNLRWSIHRRLGTLDAMAVLHNKEHPNSPPVTWRQMRHATFRDHRGLDQGYNESDCGPLGPKRQIWYTHDGPFFKREEFIDEVEGSRIDHTGWFTNSHQEYTYRGLVVKLPHGRFLAGYYSNDNGERIYLHDLHTDIKDAITAADEAARIDAEKECERNDRYDAARKIESENEEIIERIEELWALRHHPKLGEGAREELTEKVDELRNNRDKLATEYKDVEL